MTVAAIVAVVAAIAAVAAARAPSTRSSAPAPRTRTLDEEIERGKATFDEVVAREAELRAAELAQALALARAEARSSLAEEERRITEERRRDVAERERDATSTLTASLTEAQRSVEQRFADWGTDVSQLQQSLATEFERIGQRQQHLTAEVESQIAVEAERLQTALDEHRALVAKLREDLDRAVQEVAKAAAADLESHAADRRRALHEVAERLRRRERELQEQIDREQSEATQRVASQLQDVERRQIEQVRRVVSREAQRTPRLRPSSSRRRSARHARRPRAGSAASSTSPSTASHARPRVCWPSGSTPSCETPRPGCRLSRDDSTTSLRAPDNRSLQSSVTEIGFGPNFPKQGSSSRKRRGAKMAQTTEIPQTEREKVESWRLHVLSRPGTRSSSPRRSPTRMPISITPSSSSRRLHARDRRRDPALDRLQHRR